MVKYVLGGLGLVVLAVVGYLALLSLTPAKVKITCHRDERGCLVVNVKPNWRVDNVASVLFWLPGDDRYLWALGPGGAGLRRIVYGEVPGGTEQKYPPVSYTHLRAHET